MDRETLIGLLLITGSILTVTVLVLWSSREMRRIADHRLRTARDITKDLDHER